MSFHTAAFYRNVPTGAGYTELLPISDAELTINPASGRFWLSRTAMVFSAYTGGTNLTRARLYTPWKLPNEVRPVSATLLPGTVPALARWLDAPMTIPPTHEFILDCNQSNAAAQDVIGVVSFSTEGLVRPPQGEILTIRGDVSGAAPGVRTWSEVTVSWEYVLPAGPYAIIGSECISTNAIAHRWILETANWRPGALSQASLTAIPSEYQMVGKLGEWGRFNAPLMPRLEVLCNVADAIHTVFLQVIAL